jgi:hypothetical protein
MDATDLSAPEFCEKLSLIQSEIGFQAVKIHHLLGNSDKMPLPVTESLTDIILNLKTLQKNHLKPIIVLRAPEFNREDKIALLNQFLEYSEKELGKVEIKNWRFELIESSAPPDNLIKIISNYTSNIIFSGHTATAEINSPLEDTIFKATEILSKFSKINNIDPLLPIDRSISKNEPGIFNGHNGLITLNGLLKPTFHACSFLSLLGDEFLCRGDFYIVTRKKNSIQILLFNHIPLGAREADWYRAFCKNLYNENLTKKINIKLKNIIGTYKAASYMLNNKEGSIQNILMELQQPAFLNEYDKKLLNKISAPHISFEIVADKSFSYNISLEPYSIKLMILDQA